MKKIVLFTLLLITLISGCSEVLTNSEKYYENQRRRRINWREYLTD
jgi:uncharacterized protein YceK